MMIQLKPALHILYTWNINMRVTGVKRGLVAFLLQFPHVTSICSSGSLPNRTSLREWLPDSISTAPVSSQRWGSPLAKSCPPPVPIENKPDCAFAGPRNINMRREKPPSSTQRRSTGASPALNDTCTSPPAASAAAAAAAAHRQQAGEH